MRLHPLLLAVAVSLTMAVPAFAQVGTAFTVQGYLQRDGLVYDGSVDLELKLFDAAAAGTQVGGTLTPTAVPVSHGLFTAELDFGAVFDGSPRWLQVAVKAPGDAGFTALANRIAVLPGPYAIFAAGGAGGGFSLPDLSSLAVPGTTSGSDPLAGTAVLEMRNTAGAGLSHGIVGRTSSTAQNAVGVLGVGEATSGFTNGVQGLALGSSLGTGVVGIGNANGGYFRGESAGGNGVQGVTTGGRGVFGDAFDGTGLYGHAATGTGVYGRSDHPGGALGVGGIGVFGQVAGSNGTGVLGRNESTTSSGQAVFGYASGHAFGVLAVSEGSDGLSARTNAAGKSGVVGFAGASGAYGGYFSGVNGSTALRADGLAQVKTLQILGGADLAERFPVRGHCEPGTVLVLDPEVPGRLMESHEACARTVAGVVSGANDLHAGVELGDGDATAGTVPVALTGRVWVRAEALAHPIHVGDLLTTSDVPGTCAAVVDPSRTPGAVLGKAMSSLEQGTGMVLVLVTLR